MLLELTELKSGIFVFKCTLYNRKLRGCKSMEKEYVVVAEDATREIVSVIGEVTNKSERHTEKIMSGVNRNLNHEEFSVWLVGQDEVNAGELYGGRFMTDLKK